MVSATFVHDTTANPVNNTHRSMLYHGVLYIVQNAIDHMLKDCLCIIVQTNKGKRYISRGLFPLLVLRTLNRVLPVVKFYRWQRGRG